MRIWTIFEQRQNKNLIHPIRAVAIFSFFKKSPPFIVSKDFAENSEMKEGITFVFEN